MTERKLIKLGFTLVELMLAVSIIGILVTIAIPKFADLMTKSKEGATKGSLGSIRSALTIYYGDMEGQYPGCIIALTANSKYLAAVPYAKTPSYHADTSSEYDASTPFTYTNDSGGWGYDNATSNPNFGTLWVNCTHTDSKSSAWSSY